MKKLYKNYLILILAFAALVPVSDAAAGLLSDAPVAVTADNFSFKVYPNPVTGGTVQISFPFTDREYRNVSFSITNVIGQNLFSYTLTDGDFRNGQFTINLEDMKLEKGIYLIKMTSGDHSSIQKLVLR